MFSDRSKINLQENFGLDCDEDRSFKLGNDPCRSQAGGGWKFIHTLWCRYLLIGPCKRRRNLAVGADIDGGPFNINSHKPFPIYDRKSAHLEQPSGSPNLDDLTCKATSDPKIQASLRPQWRTRSQIDHHQETNRLLTAAARISPCWAPSQTFRWVKMKSVQSS